MKCSIDNFDKIIMEELENYSQEKTDGLKALIKKSAKECCKEIKKNSPKRSGKYKKGWRVRVDFESREDIRTTVHNKTNYQITHLLENGHAGKGGTSKGAAPAHPHIRPAEEHTAEKLKREVKTMVIQK